MDIADTSAGRSKLLGTASVAVAEIDCSKRTVVRRDSLNSRADRGSIERFGSPSPSCSKDREVIAGHGQIAGGAMLGLTSVPIAFRDDVGRRSAATCLQTIS